MRKQRASAFVGVLLWLVASAAGAQHLDVNVYQENGKPKIGGFSFDTLSFEDRVVFEGELMDPDLDGQFRGDEPGWTAVSDGSVASTLPPGADNLPPNAVATLDIIQGLGNRSLSYWDGNGSVSFGATPDQEVLEVLDFLGSVSVLDGTAGATGINLGTTSASGVLHEHIDFGILGDGTGTPDAATEGIYLVEAQVRVAGLADPSDPLFIIFGTITPQNDAFIEAAIETAEGWVEANLVPEPGSLMLLMAGLAGLVATGRKRA